MRIRQVALGIVFAGAMRRRPPPRSNSANSGPASSAFSTRCALGTVYPVQDNDDSGVILSGQLYFRTFVPPFQNYLANTLLRPRVHVGGNVATGDDPINQVYGGLTWNFPVFHRFFLEASFGGTLHDGPLELAGRRARPRLPLHVPRERRRRRRSSASTGGSSLRPTIPRTPTSATAETAASPTPGFTPATASEGASAA